jgi:predicted alpha/beta-hydrolase family hydrolase
MPPKRKSRASENPSAAPGPDKPRDEAPSKSKSAPKPKKTKADAKDSDPNSPISFTIPAPNALAKPIPCLHHPPFTASPSLIFTHGAGGDLSAPAVVNFSTGFTAVSPLLCFAGSSHLASRASSFAAVVAHEQGCREEGFTGALGGRSLGARAAVVAATEMVKSGDVGEMRLVLVSYPLLGPKGDVRDEILLALPKEVDVLFISGDRDRMCDLEKLNEVRPRMEARSRLVIVKGADHGMNVTPKKATATIGEETGRLAANWLKGMLPALLVHEIRWDEEEGKVSMGPHLEQDGLKGSNAKIMEKFKDEDGVPLGIGAIKKSTRNRAKRTDERLHEAIMDSVKAPPKASKQPTKRKSATKRSEGVGSPATSSGNTRSSKRRKSSKK